MKNFIEKRIRESKEELVFDYKNPADLYTFIEGGKISPARTTSLTHKEQVRLCNAIKKARNLGLVPCSHQAYDDFGKRPELISAKPFSY